ncbi:MAG: YlbF family regulator [Alicyclobacillus mali]|uniref:RicAFT regulatory complex protein RicA family protein n=1 Tax=Alicyclobacillus mali (ex Roth et al. 2021) TaxID=1123961 RepID=UPI0023F052A7|nr:YlbF family regulator [Alicyclobacillus mali (ex Roth et al. 2021)]MCL6488007.1 YlbF family regulator [Alicyclobacillus mali (ex Roth et al. 2021)]
MALATRVDTDAILAAADQLAEMIRQSDECRLYWNAREKMARNPRAQRLFDELKKKTNGLWTLRDRLGESHEKYQRMKHEADLLWESLYETPVALQYKAAQDELNGLVQEVIEVMLANLHGTLPVERGPRMCGSGGCSGGCGGSCHASAGA